MADEAGGDVGPERNLNDTPIEVYISILKSGQVGDAGIAPRAFVGQAMLNISQCVIEFGAVGATVVATEAQVIVKAQLVVPAHQIQVGLIVAIWREQTMVEVKSPSLSN